MSNKKVVIIRGLPGVGKTTMALSFADRGYVHCEADHYFHQDGVYTFNAAELTEAHEYCRNKAIAALERGQRVVVANTFTRKWELRELISQLPVSYDDVEVLVCHGGTGSVNGVPEHKVEIMRHRWEPDHRDRHVQLDPRNMKRVIAYNEKETA